MKQSNRPSFRKSSILKRLSIVSFLIAAMSVIVVAGCSSESNSSGNSGSSEPNALAVRAAASDIGLGSSRIPLNIQMADGSRLDDAADHLEVTYTPPDSDQARSVDDLTWRAWPVSSGVYTATMHFDTVGLWKIEVRNKNDEKMMPGGSGILVKSSAEAPDIGDAAPLSKTKTSPANGTLKSITSAFEPDPDLYRISFDDAVASGLPTVITFSTPAFCQSGTCGPQAEVLGQLDDKYKGDANFIHVEIFDNPEEMLAAGDPSLGIESAVIHEWEFHTEPWTFVVDGSGIVVARFEAFVTFDEIEEALVPTLTGA
jgi:hypothetical protein